MKLMKKLSLLVAIALVITIGGVYATWSYSNVDELASPTSNLALQLIQYQVVGGNLTRYGNSNVTLKIDDTNNDHNAELTLDGSLIMIFKSAAGVHDNSPADIQYTVTLKLAPTATAPGGLWQFEGKDIFTLDSSAGTTGITKQLQEITSQSFDVGGHTITGEEGNYYLVITAAELEDLITLTEAFSLHNVDEWEAFDLALRNGNIVLTFTPSNVAGASN